MSAERAGADRRENEVKKQAVRKRCRPRHNWL
jgi:hypothetical protein